MSSLGTIGRGGKGKRTEQVPEFESALWGEDQYAPAVVPAAPYVGSQTEKRTCGNPACKSGWLMPWKSRRRPIFEGKWGCGASCLEALIAVAVRREVGDGVGQGYQAPHRHRVPLGLVMLAQGWITHPQLRRALDGQRAAGAGRIGDWLIGEAGVAPERVTRALGVQWNCPVLTVEGYAPKAMALVMPRQFVEEFGVLPLRVLGEKTLYLALQDRLDAAGALALEQMTDLKVENGLLPEVDYEMAVERLLRTPCVAAARENVKDAEEMAVRIADLLDERQPIAAKLVRFHQYFWLRTWLEPGTFSSAGTLPVSTEDVFDTIFTVGVQA
jgi:hypothetical protein